MEEGTEQIILCCGESSGAFTWEFEVYIMTTSSGELSVRLSAPLATITTWSSLLENPFNAILVNNSRNTSDIPMIFFKIALKTWVRRMNCGNWLNLLHSLRRP
jgi:hypothetical protein